MKSWWDCSLELLLLLGFCAAISIPHARAEPVAIVIFAVGDAVAIGAGGELRALAKQSSIEVGDTIESRTARVQLRFTDGALMSLQPQTQFRVDEYRYSGGADDTERGFFTLLKGGLRTITGAIGRVKQASYQIITNLATIGVRGTEYSIAYGPNGLVGSVGEGGIDVCNGVGCFGAASGESFAVADASSKPRMRDKKTDLAPAQPQSPSATFLAGETRGPNGELTAILIPQPVNPVNFPDQKRTTAVAYPNVETTLLQVSSSVDAAPNARGEVGNLEVCGNGCNARWRENVADASRNGLLAWGRWTGGATEGHVIDLSQGRSLHYIVGTPGQVDIESLRARNTVAHYSLTGSTTPTTIDGGSLGRLIDARLSAYFTADPYVTLGVSVSMNGEVFTGAGTGAVTGSTFSGRGGQQGSTSISGFTPNADIGFAGFFTGRNAEDAGVVYELQSNHGPITGAAALQRGSTAPLQ